MWFSGLQTRVSKIIFYSLVAQNSENGNPVIDTDTSRVCYWTIELWLPALHLLLRTSSSSRLLQQCILQSLCLCHICHHQQTGGQAS